MQDEAEWLERVLSLAESRGIAQRRIVEAAGVEPARIGKWRKGSKPTLSNLMAIGQLLDVSLDWIATGAGPASGYPKDPLTDEERSLLWMLRSTGVSPEEAAAFVSEGKAAGTAGATKVVGLRVRERSAATDGKPADVGLDDTPSRPVVGDKRRRRRADLDLSKPAAKLKDGGN